MKLMQRQYSHFFCSHCHILDNKLTTFENKSIAFESQHLNRFPNYALGVI